MSWSKPSRRFAFWIREVGHGTEATLPIESRRLNSSLPSLESHFTIEATSLLLANEWSLRTRRRLTSLLQYEAMQAVRSLEARIQGMCLLPTIDFTHHQEGLDSTLPQHSRESQEPLPELSNLSLEADRAIQLENLRTNSSLLLQSQTRPTLQFEARTKRKKRRELQQLERTDPSQEREARRETVRMRTSM
jgi:hypothetical protein